MPVKPLNAILESLRKLLFPILASAVIIGCAAGTAKAGISCSYSYSGINFGSVDVSSGSPVYTTGTVTISCLGASSGTWRFCTNLPPGPDVSGTQRRMVSGGNYLKMGIPFTPAIPGATIRRWKAPFIPFPEPIIPGPFTKWTNGSAPMPPVATMSGACGGRMDLCARNAARRVSRGPCRETGSGVAPASGKQL